jgi:hypothetical protein
MQHNKYLPAVYIALSILSNLKMTKSIWEGVSRFYVNAMKFSVRVLGALRGRGTNFP